MNKNTQRLIEDTISSATDIHFHTTPDYNKEPPAFKFAFSNPNMAFSAWEALHKFFSNSESTANIFVKNDRKLDLSFTSKVNAETINIKGLNYEKQNLLEFEEKESKDRKIMLLMGPQPSKDFRVLLPESVRSPLIIDSFKIHLPVDE